MSKIRPYCLAVFALFIIFAFSGGCSSKSEKRPSPLAKDSTSVDGALVTVEYSSPAVRKRKIWGELVPYGEVWRTGANKATFLTTSKDIYVQGKVLVSGRYSIFTIPSDSTWTIIFNEDWDQWGSYNYDEDKDAFRIELIPTKSSFDERMKFVFEDGYIRFDWEELTYRLELKRKR